MSALIINRLLAMRAELDAMLADLGVQPAPANQQTVAPSDVPKWMKLPEFSRHMNMSVGTLRSRLDEGMPASGTGHGRRIKVADAEAWLAKRE